MSTDAPNPPRPGSPAPPVATQPQPASTDARRSIYGTVTSNAVVTVTLLAASAYAVTRLSHVTFYNRFGVDPSEVGLTYTETLSRAAAGLVVLTLASIGIGLFYWRWGRSRLKASETYAETDGTTRPADLARSGLMRWAGVIVTAYLLLGPLLVVLPWVYRGQSIEVLRGNSMRPGFWVKAITNPLGIRAERVRVDWVDERGGPYDFGTRNIIYLGRANGIAVLYDPKFHRTVRVPDTAIVIRRRDYVLANQGAP